MFQAFAINNTLVSFWGQMHCSQREEKAVSIAPHNELLPFAKLGERSGFTRARYSVRNQLFLLAKPMLIEFPD